MKEDQWQLLQQGMGWPIGDDQEESRQKNMSLCSLSSAWMNTEREDIDKYGLVLSPKNFSCDLQICL